MENKKQLQKYIMIAIAGIAIAAYIVPTSGWIDFNSAFAGTSGDGGCEAGDGGSGGEAFISNFQSISQTDEGDDEYGNINTGSNTFENSGSASANGGNGGICVGGDGALYEAGDGGNGGIAAIINSQAISQVGGPNSNTGSNTFTNTGSVSANGGNGGSATGLGGDGAYYEGGDGGNGGIAAYS